jgi:hypothetical protein
MIPARSQIIMASTDGHLVSRNQPAAQLARKVLQAIANNGTRWVAVGKDGLVISLFSHRMMAAIVDATERRIRIVSRVPWDNLTGTRSSQLGRFKARNPLAVSARHNVDAKDLGISLYSRSMGRR